MKPINFISIEEANEPRGGRTVEPVPSKPVKFYGLTETGENNSKTQVVVENQVIHQGAVKFFGITDAASTETLEAEQTSVEPGTSDPIVSSEATQEEAPDDDVKTFAHPTVMIIEDDQIVSTMLRHILARKGYQIEIAADGRRAAELIESEIPPALVILDVMLPFVDGFELIEKIRANDVWAKVPIIMLTAKTREADIVRALESGADDYIAKPFQPQELIARVKRFVRKE